MELQPRTARTCKRCPALPRSRHAVYCDPCGRQKKREAAFKSAEVRRGHSQRPSEKADADMPPDEIERILDAADKEVWNFV